MVPKADSSQEQTVSKPNSTPHMAIQGFEGCFHQQAANHFFNKNVTVECCTTFKDVMAAAKDAERTDGCIMAIENSIAGSILANYNLIQGSNLKIVGEVYMQIHQNLLVNHGVTLEDIKEVHSHTMALQQCYEYLDQYKWKLVESDDTALSAKHIAQYKSKHTAAIASSLAAEIYDLNVIAPKIQTLKKNYTRFLVLKRPEDIEEPQTGNKASINFQTIHKEGALARVLGVMAIHKVNMSKLQSFPIPGSEFKYQFHADLEFDNIKTFERVIEKLKPLTEAIKIYGIYNKGIWK
ncbi:prephenate dehydratase [Niabella yanshanensis]|uniref:prephenate dehydratase n=1 Tax=Niabella yanshanensis TaxID=577386 RepID=A0ABZ0WB25_9BACT|nr:prephenate dehydratase [Niabella yanshanensis]WQD39829.1 prephenate dehydratase [Niabella yanshanensis]